MSIACQKQYSIVISASPINLSLTPNPSYNGDIVMASVTVTGRPGTDVILIGNTGGYFAGDILSHFPISLGQASPVVQDLWAIDSTAPGLGQSNHVTQTVNAYATNYWSRDGAAAFNTFYGGAVAQCYVKEAPYHAPPYNQYVFIDSSGQLLIGISDGHSYNFQGPIPPQVWVVEFGTTPSPVYIKTGDQRFGPVGTYNITDPITYSTWPASVTVTDT